MAQLIIDDTHGFETVYSLDPRSPAAPYIDRYSPRGLDDLHELGLIPKYVPLKHLRTARDKALAHSHSYIDFAGADGGAPMEQRAQSEARSQSRLIDSAVGVMSRTLVNRNGYDPAEATLLSRKVLAFESNLFAQRPALTLVIVNLTDRDFLIKTPLVIDQGIHGLIAKDVIIYKRGTLRLQGSYFWLSCRSFRGEQMWYEGRLDPDAERARRAQPGLG